MKRSAAILALLAVALIPQLTLADALGLEAGQKAPDFKMLGSDGNEYTLQQFRGKKPVVIAWFPKAFTGG
jgi:peroxiredoxin Q/BCP